MATNVTLDWSQPHNNNDGKLTLWLSEAKGLFPVASHIGDTSFYVFEDEETYAFVGLETLEPEGARCYTDVLRAQDFPLVDVPQAGLKNVYPAEALLWALDNLRPERK